MKELLREFIINSIKEKYCRLLELESMTKRKFDVGSIFSDFGYNEFIEQDFDNEEFFVAEITFNDTQLILVYELELIEEIGQFLKNEECISVTLINDYSTIDDLECFESMIYEMERY